MPVTTNTRRAPTRRTPAAALSSRGAEAMRRQRGETANRSGEGRTIAAEMVNKLFDRVMDSPLLALRARGLWRRTSWLTMLFVVAFAGCGGSTADTADGKPAREGTVEDHHGIPPHKPTSFARAVRGLPRRLSVFETGPNVAPDPTLLQELVDIVRWLPELAADTGLPRADWERVQELSKRMEQAVTATPPDVAACGKIAAELKPFGEKARKLDEKLRNEP